MENKKARENFKAILRGKAPDKELSTAEAKTRLRAADPDLDIGRPLMHLARGEVKQAGFTLAVEVATTITLPYLRPMITTSLLGLQSLLAGDRKSVEKTKA